MTIKEAAFLIMESLYDFELEGSEDGFVAGDPERELQGVATTFVLSVNEIRNLYSVIADFRSFTYMRFTVLKTGKAELPAICLLT